MLQQNYVSPAQTNVKKHDTRNTKQNGLAHPRFIVCVTPKQKTLFRETFKLFWESKQCLIRETCFHRNMHMCQTKTNVCVSLYRQRYRWLMFRRCFVYRVHYPELTSRCKTGWTSVCLIRETLLCETIFIISGWRRRMWKTISYSVSHLFSVFWRPFALENYREILEQKKNTKKTNNNKNEYAIIDENIAKC